MTYDPARSRELAEKALEYGHHHPWCYAVSKFQDGLKCDCGWAEVRAQLDALRKETR